MRQKFDFGMEPKIILPTCSTYPFRSIPVEKKILEKGTIYTPPFRPWADLSEILTL